MRLDRPRRGVIALAAALLGPIVVTAAPTRPATATPASGAPATPLALAVVRPTSPCASLAGVDLVAIGGAGSRVVRVSETTSRGVAVCSVEGTLAPAIGFRVDLPTATWTQRYMQLGCGGLCGRTSLQVGAADGCPTVAAGGFVLASTDMGHQGQETAWGADPRQRADFAYRGVHLTALAAKALIARFYGQAARFSYFNGCSDGGREALVEAQRFPGDFDGIVAGAAAMNFQVQNSLYHGWQAVSNTGTDGKAILLAPRLPILHAAVLAACDGNDGIKDGLVSAPGRCRFDPATIACKPGDDAGTCLTAAEVAVVRKLYDGPRDPRTGERLTAGGPQFGSELAWAGVYVPQTADQPIMSAGIALEAMRHLIFAESLPADYRLADLRFDAATFDRLRARHPLFDATDPDLSAFAARGGKLILWHGWADPHISPLNTIRYHEAVRRTMGAAKAERFERLYLLPGVHHCSGGEGPSLIDLLTPMMAWVERGQAPDAIVTHPAPAGRQNGFGQPGASAQQAAPAVSSADPARGRPVYPYPFVAAYTDRGNVGDAASWRRGERMPVAVPAWRGDDFYRPYRGISRFKL